MKIKGLPVIDVDESEEITVAVRADDLLEGDTRDPERHPIALRRQDNVDEARVTKNETLVRRGKKVPLTCPGQAVVQPVAEDAHGAGLGHQLLFLGGAVLGWLSTATTPIRSAAPM